MYTEICRMSTSTLSYKETYGARSGPDLRKLSRLQVKRLICHMENKQRLRVFTAGNTPSSITPDKYYIRWIGNTFKGRQLSNYYIHKYNKCKESSHRICKTMHCTYSKGGFSPERRAGNIHECITLVICMCVPMYC